MLTGMEASLLGMFIVYCSLIHPVSPFVRALTVGHLPIRILRRTSRGQGSYSLYTPLVCCVKKRNMAQRGCSATTTRIHIFSVLSLFLSWRRWQGVGVFHLQVLPRQEDREPKGMQYEDYWLSIRAWPPRPGLDALCDSFTGKSFYIPFFSHLSFARMFLPHCSLRYIQVQ